MTAYGEVLRQTVDREYGSYTHFVCLIDLCIICTAYNSDHIFILFLCTLCNTDHNFAAKTLGIQLSFTGDNVISITDHFIKLYSVQNRLDAHLQTGAKESDHACAHSACCAGSRNFTDVFANCFCNSTA